LEVFLRFITVLSLWLALSGLGTAATLTTSATCSGPNGVVTGPTCSIGSTTSFPYARGTAAIDQYLLAGNEFRASVSTYSIAPSGFQYNVYSTASVTITLLTDGPVREGRLGGSLSFERINYGGTGSASFESDPSISPLLSYQPQNFQRIQLGVPFTLTLSSFSQADGFIVGNNNTSHIDGARLDLLFFEADRITPVTVYEAVPEPSAAGLTAVALLLLAISCRKSIVRFLA
jgi:hypothetical protein